MPMAVTMPIVCSGSSVGRIFSMSTDGTATRCELRGGGPASVVVVTPVVVGAAAVVDGATVVEAAGTVVEAAAAVVGAAAVVVGAAAGLSDAAAAETSAIAYRATTVNAAVSVRRATRGGIAARVGERPRPGGSC
jgi:hypothetical protein